MSNRFLIWGSVILGGLLLLQLVVFRGGIIDGQYQSKDQLDFLSLESSSITSSKAEEKVVPDELKSGSYLPETFRRGAIAKSKEAVLIAKERSFFDRLLQSSDGNGFKILKTLDRLQSVRVEVSDWQKFSDFLGENKENLIADPNYYVSLPQVPSAQTSSGDVEYVPFGEKALEWLGISEVNPQWGSGVTVAVLDTGVQDHVTFSSQSINQVNLLEGGQPSSEQHGHGTAVGSLVTGNHPAAPGVAPAANILSIQVLDQNGVGDSFTLAEGIIQAVDSGAQVINLSLGGHGESLIVQEALSYAQDKQVAVVAAVGNESVTQVGFPANQPSVLAVAGVDAVGQHLYFSNVGAQVDVAAPGLGIHAAWPGDKLIQFTGTSASAPLVSGTIAAMLSQDPRLSPLDAMQLVREFSNETGAPGRDNVFGYGNLNVRRLMQRGQQGLYDIGVASHYIDPAILASSPSGKQIPVAVTVQNRGTEVIYNGQLQVRIDNRNHFFSVGVMKPGEIFSKSISFYPPQREFEIRSTAKIPQTDIFSADNELPSVFSRVIR